MDKISIEVLLPAVNRKYEFLLPVVMKVHVAKDLMTRTVCNMEGVSVDRHSLILYSLEKGREIELNMSVEEAGIKDGSQLMMV